MMSSTVFKAFQLHNFAILLQKQNISSNIWKIFLAPGL